MFLHIKINGRFAYVKPLSRAQLRRETSQSYWCLRAFNPFINHKVEKHRKKARQLIQVKRFVLTVDTY